MHKAPFRAKFGGSSGMEGAAKSDGAAIVIQGGLSLQGVLQQGDTAAVGRQRHLPAHAGNVDAVRIYLDAGIGRKRYLQSAAVLVVPGECFLREMRRNVR